MKIRSLPSRDILSYVTPYQPGKPISEVQREYGLTKVIKLASNENHLGAAPSALKALSDAMKEVHLYPDGSGYELKNALSKVHGFSPEDIILGNGSIEIIDIICKTFLNNGDHAVTAWPAFFKYRIAILTMGGYPIEVPLKYFTHDLEAMEKAITYMTKLVFIADPNNPTGTMVHKNELEGFIRRIAKKIVVVVDQAYYEYVAPEKRLEVKKLIREGYNIIALRTFSKIYGLAGLRIGYGFARPEIIQEMNKGREAFNTNSLAQTAAIGALQDTDFVQKSLSINKEALETMCAGFDKLGLKYVPTLTNFVLVDFERDARYIFEELLKRGVIIRPMRGYGMDTCARISSAPVNHIEYFLEQLKEILKK